MKNIFATTIIFFLFIGKIFSQTEDLSLKYAGTITPDALRAHLSILAGDFYEGRETGTRGLNRAADYISKQFQLDGIPPLKSLGGYFEHYDLMQSGWDSTWITAGKKRYDLLQDFYAYAVGNNAAQLHAEEIIFMGFGIDDSMYSDYKNVDVTGKIILVASGEPQRNGNSLITGTTSSSEWSQDWRKKVTAATTHGVACILVIDPAIASVLANPQWVNYLKNGNLQLQQDVKPVTNCNNIFISEEMAKALLGKKAKLLSKTINNINTTFIAQHFSAKADITMHIAKVQKAVGAQNVLGYVEGTDLKDQLVVVSAHYDHLGKKDTVIYNGADDDGSGTVALLELAQAAMLAKTNGEGARRSILFLSFSGEEKGLLGSRTYTDNPVFPLANTVADLNIDMVGRVDEAHMNDSDYVYIIGSDFLSTELHRINEAAAKTYTTLKLDYKYNSTTDVNRYYYRSDHYNFAKNNIPVIFYFNGTHEDYHQPTDDVEKIDFPLLAERAQLVWHTLWIIANQDNRLKVDGVLESPEEK